MSDKLKRLAKNITELLTNTETPQDTYYSLVHLMKKQKDYFQHLPAESILKLTFYCYSLGHTGSFELADKMLNQIGFAVLFNKSGDKFITGSYDRTCKVWDTITGQELLSLEEHKNVVYTMAFNNPYGYTILNKSSIL